MHGRYRVIGNLVTGFKNDVRHQKFPFQFGRAFRSLEILFFSNGQMQQNSIEKE
jgi:hypothetical protein